MTPDERVLWVRQMGARRDWWALRNEPIIEPDWKIVDCHFHLWNARDFPNPLTGSDALRTSRYLLEEFVEDTNSGHAVDACVYIECGSQYLTTGPQSFRPVGETAFAVAMSERLKADRSAPDMGAIVSHANLQLPNLRTILDAHQQNGAGLFRSVRHSAARLDDPSKRLLAGAASAGLLLKPEFRRGVAMLGERDLSFDAFQFHFQLDELVELARAVPQTTIIINHLGGPVGFNKDQTGNDPIFDVWSKSIDQLADIPNVVMKLSGMASIVTGYDGHKRNVPPSSQTFVIERGAYFHHAIKQFGAERCMFGSNFPVDSASISYQALWNAYKIIAKDYSRSQRNALLADTARRIYRF